MVYPGQTFDNPIDVERVQGGITAGDVKASVEEFHRRNEEARLIEARSQEPMIRGVRLLATGMVDQPRFAEVAEDPTAPVPIGTRRVFAGDEWHLEVPVFDGELVRPGPAIHGPAIVQSRFTTLVLRPGDRAVALPNGDILVHVG
jgi:N-methylhydantoinase A